MINYQKKSTMKRTVYKYKRNLDVGLLKIEDSNSSQFNEMTEKLKYHKRTNQMRLYK